MSVPPRTAWYTPRVPLDRRAFLRFAAALPLSSSVISCGEAGSPEDQLLTRLGLSAAERPWVAALGADDQQHLLAALKSGDGDRRARELLFRLLEPRDRLFSYVGYPAVSRRRSVCDGLLRE